ncbi:RiPP maturation radical SAM C-methyltransferase [Hoeflea sp.]|uniref:RiPP maturation radical SAM C-methyltransferase n=1 Tax=Hoeflea sp. TaxID=1940281 RepID=UPI00374A254F
MAVDSCLAADAHVPSTEEIEEAVEIALDVSDCNSADLILLLPAFASPEWPSLGLHILAGIAEASGLKVRVLYANLAFARTIGPKFYRALCVTKTEELVGERIFRNAYPVAPEIDAPPIPSSWSRLCDNAPPEFQQICNAAEQFSSTLARKLATLPFSIIGVSSTFEQTFAGLSVISEMKRMAPAKITLMGGANVDGAMASGLCQFDGFVDHFFQGESEASFKDFLSDYLCDEHHGKRVYSGSPNANLDAIPQPDFETFFKQYEELVSAKNCKNGLDPKALRITYESSRGCWWGQKHHCTFCGLNANGMEHRTKSADKVHRELNDMHEKYGVADFLMVDNIMPHRYFSTLLPKLQKTENELKIFYEQKSNLSMEKMILLHGSGVRSIQPGIESLSTSLLRRMKKGATTRVNLDCMRNARAVGVNIVWNLLCDFPGDSVEDYKDMIRIIPQLEHLQPPTGIGGLSVDRFSPYFDTPENFGISSVEVLGIYDYLFPKAINRDIAYHFRGNYSSGVRNHPEVFDELEDLIKDWIAKWGRPERPNFSVFDLDEDKALVFDTRSFAREPIELVNDKTRKILLTGTNELDTGAKRLLDDGWLVHCDEQALPIICPTVEIHEGKSQDLAMLDIA